MSGREGPETGVDEKRRAEVQKAIDFGVSAKVMRDSLSAAREALEKARDLARREPALPWPWPQHAAFRLAYLEARSARSVEQVREVLALLDEVHDAKRVLDPLQYGLQIVMKERLAKLSPSDPRCHPDRIAAAFERLVASSTVRRPFRVQSQLLNLVELLALLTAQDYAPLEGRGAIPAANLLSNGFLLVGTGKIDTDVRMSRHLAEGELRARIESGHVDLAFTWLEDDEVRLVHPVERPLPRTEASRWLGDFCQGVTSNDARMDESTMREGLASLRRALKQALAEKHAALAARDTIRHDRVRSLYRIHPDLAVIGLVDEGVWRTRPGSAVLPPG